METTYYGTTQHGTKIHLGNEVWEQRGKDQWIVKTKCGSDMTTCNIDEPLPQKVDEYCKTCYRSVAWDYYRSSQLARADRGR